MKNVTLLTAMYSDHVPFITVTMSAINKTLEKKNLFLKKQIYISICIKDTKILESSLQNASSSSISGTNILSYSWILTFFVQFIYVVRFSSLL